MAYDGSKPANNSPPVAADMRENFRALKDDGIVIPANNSVTNAKIATGAVSTAKLADGAVTNAKIAAGAVTESKIANGVITNYKLASYTQGTQYLLISANAEKQSSENPYNWEKIREFEIIRCGSLTIYFEFRHNFWDYGPVAYARIYRNGNPVGVEHSTTSGTFVPVWEGISGWSPFDRVQLYVRVQHVPDLFYRAIVRNFRLYTNTRLTFTEKVLL